MKLPTPLYEAIPHIYGISAIITILSVDSPIAFVSSFFFGYAAWLVYKTRRDYRTFKGIKSDIVEQ